MSLSPEQVLHIARLARVGLTPEEVDRFATQLSGILDHFEALSAVDTEGVEPTAHPLPLANIMRSDEITPSLPRDAVLANAPETEDGLLRVRAVLE
jgi:aspartyl-tRNA(Asn)/glutamyl-tRNA(Gln) amidotransferase subunit C